MIGTTDRVKLSASQNQIMFSFGRTRVLTRRLEGRFPNYKQLLPRSFTTKVTAEHSELLNSVKRVSLLALDNAAIEVKVSAENQSITLSSKASDSGSAQESILVKTEGEDNSISINFSYFIDGLNSINTETVFLEIQDPLRPGILRAPEENFTYLVMPVRS
jgi:DNA polymerase-3 subunit beta